MQQLRRSIVRGISIFVLLACASMGLPVKGAESEAPQSVSEMLLSCAWNDVSNVGIMEDDVIPVVSGEKTAFDCKVTASKGKERNASLLLVGKQIDAKNGTDAVAGNVAMEASVPSQVILEFPAVYRPGAYQYTFSLFDTETKQPVAKEFILNGEMEGDAKMQVAIDRVLFDKEQYAWDDSFTLNVTLHFPEKQNLQSEPVTLSVAMQDRNGAPCAVLADNQGVTNTEEKLSLKFPKEGVCINSMVVEVRDAQGGVLDQKILAVGLPEKKVSDQPMSSWKQGTFLASVPLAVQVGLVITVMVIITLSGYFLLRRQKRKY